MKSYTQQIDDDFTHGHLRADKIAVGSLEAVEGDFYLAIQLSRPKCTLYPAIELTRILSPDEAEDMAAMLLKQAGAAKQKAMGKPN